MVFSDDEEIADEFLEINKNTSRATWSNICRPAMRTMANIVADPVKFKPMKRSVIAITN